MEFRREPRWHLLALLLLGCMRPVVEAGKHVVVFHNTVPSTLYVNAAHGPVHIKDDPDGKTEIINLLLYPTDQKSRAPKTARAVFNSGSVTGLVTFRQDNPPLGPTFIVANLVGLKAGRNGIKIFEFGDIKDSCTRLGRVYNPYHLDPSTSVQRRQIGDIGFLMASPRGKADVALSDPFVSLVGPRSVIGRSIAIVEDGDPSQPSPNKLGCAVIGFAK